MAHLVVTAMPFAGHVRPMTALAAALIGRGHRVTAYTSAGYAEAFARAGCAVATWRAAGAHRDPSSLEDAWSAAHGLEGPAALAALRDTFIGTALGQVADIRALDRSDHVDAVIGDVMAVGSGLAAEVLDRPWVSVSVAPLTLPRSASGARGTARQTGDGFVTKLRRALRPGVTSLSERVEEAYHVMRDELALSVGLPFERALLSSRLALATGCRALQPDGDDLPAAVRFVGVLAPAGRIVPAEPGSEPLGSRPVALVAQTALEFDPQELMTPSLEVLGAAPGGSAAGASIRAAVPRGGQLSDVFALEAVLPRASVGITNGGWGGTLAMLAHGVPLVIAGDTPCEREVAARVGFSGAGIDLRSARLTAEQLADAVREVLGDERYLERARAVAFELNGLGGRARAAELIDGTLARG